MGTRVMPKTVSNLNKVYAKIEAWHNRLIEGERPYLYFDGIVMKRQPRKRHSWAHPRSSAARPYESYSTWLG